MGLRAEHSFGPLLRVRGKQIAIGVCVPLWIDDRDRGKFQFPRLKLQIQFATTFNSVWRVNQIVLIEGGLVIRDDWVGVVVRLQQGCRRLVDVLNFVLKSRVRLQTDLWVLCLQVSWGAKILQVWIAYLHSDLSLVCLLLSNLLDHFCRFEAFRALLGALPTALVFVNLSDFMRCKLTLLDEYVLEACHFCSCVAACTDWRLSLWMFETLFEACELVAHHLRAPRAPIYWHPFYLFVYFF